VTCFLFLVFFMFGLFIIFLILQVYSDFVEETHFDTIGVISVVFVGGTHDVSIGVTNVVSNGVVGSYPILWVHDYSIVVAFGGPLSNILPNVPSFSCIVIVGFTN